MTTEEIYQLSGIDSWFLEKIREIVVTENEVQAWLAKWGRSVVSFTFLEADGLSPTPVWLRLRTARREIRNLRKEKGVEAVFCSVDTCGAEFAAFTPYLYSTYEGKMNPNQPSERRS